jgi:hypothetical protein
VKSLAWALIVGIPLSLDKPLETRRNVIGRKMPEIVLKRVRDESVAEPDIGLTKVLDPCAWKSSVHEIVEVGVVGELDVAAEVPGEAFAVHK